jgi:hypothetical protein
MTESELESSMNRVQIEQKSYEMPPQEGVSVAHFLVLPEFPGDFALDDLREKKKGPGSF